MKLSEKDVVYHSTFNFPPRNELLYSSDKSKELIQSKAESCWSYSCLYFPGQRSHYVGFKGFSSIFYHGMQEGVFILFLLYKWKPRRWNNLPKVTDANLPRYLLTLI